MVSRIQKKILHRKIFCARSSAINLAIAGLIANPVNNGTSLDLLVHKNKQRFIFGTENKSSFVFMYSKSHGVMFHYFCD